MKTTDFVESVIPHLDLRDKTKKNYLGAFRKNLKPSIGDKDIQNVTKSEIMTCLDVLPTQTKYQTLMVARTVFNEAVERGLINESPAKTIKQPKVTPKPQKFLTWEQLKSIEIKNDIINNYNNVFNKGFLKNLNKNKKILMNIILKREIRN